MISLEFVFTPAIVVSIVVILVVVFISVLAGLGVRHSYSSSDRQRYIRDYRNSLKEGAKKNTYQEDRYHQMVGEDVANKVLSILVVPVLFAVVTAVAQLFWYGVSFDTKSYPSFAVAAEQTFGLESGEEYPLVTGSLISGSTTNVSASAGLFHHSVSMNSQLSTGFMVDFVTDDARYPVLIPSDNVTYRTAGVEPGGERIVMEIDADEVQYSYGVGYFTYECEKKFVNLFVMCVNDEESRTFVSEARSLSDITEGSLDHAVVYMTEENYEKLFGFNS